MGTCEDFVSSVSAESCSVIHLSCVFVVNVNISLKFFTVTNEFTFMQFRFVLH